MIGLTLLAAGVILIILAVESSVNRNGLTYVSCPGLCVYNYSSDFYAGLVGVIAMLAGANLLLRGTFGLE